jgi:predicted metal-dependent peptidase
MPQLAPGREDLKDAPGAEHPETRERIEQEVKAMVDRAVAMAKAMGNLPAGIEKEVIKASKPAREPWFNHLHRYMQSLAISEYNWARMNRRAMLTHKCFAPLHYSEALGVVDVYVDTSGRATRPRSSQLRRAPERHPGRSQAAAGAPALLRHEGVPRHRSAGR